MLQSFPLSVCPWAPVSALVTADLLLCVCERVGEDGNKTVTATQPNQTKPAHRPTTGGCVLQRGAAGVSCKTAGRGLSHNFQNKTWTTWFCWRGFAHVLPLRLAVCSPSRPPVLSVRLLLLPLFDTDRPTQTVAAADPACAFVLLPSAPVLLCAPTTAPTRPTTYAPGWCGWCSCSVACVFHPKQRNKTCSSAVGVGTEPARPAAAFGCCACKRTRLRRYCLSALCCI